MARDISRVAFEARLEGLGFNAREEVPFLGTYFRHPEFPSSSFGSVKRRGTGRMMYRETLAYLEQQLESSRQRGKKTS